MDDSDRPPRRKITHDVGQALDDLSVHELDERVTLLRDEIVRLLAAKERKQSALHVAGAVFGAAPPARS